VVPDEFIPATQTELSRYIGDNARGAAHPLYPVGGRTSLEYGYPVKEPGITLPLSRLTRTIDYPARDMTITVEAGLRVEELAAQLRVERQRLPVDIPQAHRATLGGAIATNASGPGRFGHGTLRDYVIGVSGIDASGRLFKAGGRVVKNVAGYDLCKLMIGSLGTLAVVTQVTLKLKPLPDSRRLLWCSFGTLGEVDAALEKLTLSETRPVAIEVLTATAAAQIAAEARADLPVSSPVLCVAVEGTELDTNWQAGTLRQELSAFSPQQMEDVVGPATESVWGALTEFQTSTEEPVTFKANLRPSRVCEFLQRAQERGVALQSHAGNGIVIGHLPDSITSAQSAEEILAPLRQFAREASGNLVILHCDAAWKQTLPVFGVPDRSWTLMQKVKHELDPHDLFNRGRLFRAAD